MCVNFTPPTRQQLELHFGATAPAEDWKQETWQDYTAPIIVAGDEGWQALLASYGMIPKRKLPEEAKRFSTINADAHPLMSRMHKPDAEKRTLVIVSADEYDAWLTCRDPELARSFLRLYPAELLQAEPAPIAR